MFRTRALSAAVLIPLVAGLTYAGGWLLLTALLIVAVLSAYEFSQLMKSAGYQPSLVASTGVMAAFLVAARYPNLHLTGLVLAAAVMFTLIWHLLGPPQGQPTQSWALTLGVALWLGWLISHFILLRDLSPDWGLGIGTR